MIHWVRPRRWFLLSGAVCAGSLLLASLSASTAATVFWLTVLGFGAASLWPTILGSAGDRFPQAGAVMFGLLAAAGNFGGVVGPVTVGLAADALGLRAGMGLLAVAPLAATAAMLLLLRRPAIGAGRRPEVLAPDGEPFA